MKNKIYAVLTGDLVNSSRLTIGESQMAMQWLREASGEFATLYPGSIEGVMDTFRHDSWQVLLRQPSMCLRVALYFRTAIKLHSDKKTSFDTRISIGLGEVESIAEARISDSRGRAFTISGKNLDTMTRNRLVCQAQDEDSVEFTLLSRTTVPLLDRLVSDWTSTEAHAVHGAIEGRTQEEIAQSLPLNPRTKRAVTRQAVSDSLERAYWGTVEDVLEIIENESKLWGLQ
jgi:hypothetical protein